MSARTGEQVDTAVAPTPPDVVAPSHGGRRRARRVLFVLGLLPLSLTLVLVLKVAVMLQLNSDGRDSYEDGEFASADAAFERTLAGNVLERWVAPYDLGTAEYREDDFGAARGHLEEALALAPAEAECRVRINLALAEEALGDAAVADGDVTGARDHWAAGRAVLAEGGCTSTSGATGSAEVDPSGSPSETDDPSAAGSPAAGAPGRVLTAVAVDSRLADKLSGAQEPDENNPPTEPSGLATQSVEERNEQAERIRQRNEQKHQDEADETPPPPSAPPSGSSDPPPPPHYDW